MAKKFGLSIESLEEEYADDVYTEDATESETESETSDEEPVSTVEDSEETPEVVVHDVTSDELETTLMEVDDAKQRIDVGDDCVEEAIETTESLESLYEIASASKGIGGLNRPAAEILHASVEKFAKDLGYNPNNLCLNTSMESFEGVATRGSATEVSLEGISDLVKKAWEKIIEAIKNSIEAIKNFFKKVFDSVYSLEERAKKIIKLAEKIPDNAKKEIKVKNPKLARVLSIDNKIISAQSAVNLTSVTMSLLVNKWSPEKTIDSAISCIDKLIQDKNYDIESLRSSVSNNMPIGWANNKADTNLRNKILDRLNVTEDKDSYDVVVSDVLPGNYLLYSAYRDNAGKNDKGVSKRFFYSSGVYHLSEIKIPDTEIKLLDKSAVIAICKKVLDVVAEIRKLESKLKTIKTKKEQFSNKVKQLSDSSVKDSKQLTEQTKEVTTAIMRRGEITSVFHQVIKCMDEPTVSYLRYSLKECAGLLTYCNRSATSLLSTK